jgi:hypothetical protein
MPETKRDAGPDWMSDCAMKIYDEWVNNRAGDPDAIYAILRSFAPQSQDASKEVPMAMLRYCYCAGPLLQGQSINEILREIAQSYGYTVK